MTHARLDAKRFDLYKANKEDYELLLQLQRPKQLRGRDNVVILFPDPENQSCNSSGACLYKACFIQDGKLLLSENHSLKEAEMGNLRIENQGLLTSKNITDYYELINQALVGANLEVPKYINILLMLEDMRNHPEVLKAMQYENNRSETHHEVKTSQTPEIPDYQLIYNDLVDKNIPIKAAVEQYAEYGYTKMVDFLLGKNPETLIDAVYGAAKEGQIHLLEHLILVCLQRAGLPQDFSWRTHEHRHEMLGFERHAESIIDRALEGLAEYAEAHNKLPSIIDTIYYSYKRGYCDPCVVRKFLSTAAFQGEEELVKFFFNRLPRSDYGGNYSNDLVLAIRFAAKGDHQNLVMNLISYSLDNRSCKLSYWIMNAIIGTVEEAINNHNIPQIKFAETLMSKYSESDINVNEIFKGMVQAAIETGYLKNENKIILVLSQFEQANFRKSFLKAAPEFFKEYDIETLLSKANQLYLANQNNNLDQQTLIALPEIYDLFAFISQPSHMSYLNVDLWTLIATYISPFNIANDKQILSAIQQTVVLKEIREYASRIAFWRHPFQRNEANAFLQGCEDAAKKGKLMETVDEVKPAKPDGKNNELFAVVAKYQHKKM